MLSSPPLSIFLLSSSGRRTREEAGGVLKKILREMEEEKGKEI
jgi:hypothetical protein